MEVSFSLLCSHTTFTVNGTTGTVLVANGSNLDWRIRPIYYATLQATDGGNLTGFTQLEIYVIDINDNPPVVIGSYMVFVTEGEKMEPVQILVSPMPSSFLSFFLFGHACACLCACAPRQRPN